MCVFDGYEGTPYLADHILNTPGNVIPNSPSRESAVKKMCVHSNLVHGRHAENVHMFGCVTQGDTYEYFPILFTTATMIAMTTMIATKAPITMPASWPEAMPSAEHEKKRVRK